MTRDDLVRACRSLYGVGGLYEILALIVWNDNIHRVEGGSDGEEQLFDPSH